MSPSTADVKSIFSRSLEIRSASERAVFLDRACSGQPAVRAEVDGLLRAHGDAGSFLGRPAVPGLDTAPCAGPPVEGVGASIGPYRLMERIGEGGMGLVFVAEQHQPVRRKVALKVIKPGMDTQQVVARFEAERQALALMDHPHIARVLDAGTTHAGRPYFVMELVRGVPITEYCDANDLPPRQRLELFLQVCNAVQHAHQKGVIHRDLKPSNILVAPHDGVPVVKVIDFGVAKALGQQLTEKTIYTSFAQMVGTPLYMSPEQAEMNQLDVDTRSDIYSLGVLLYELLTGTTPLDRQRFQQAAVDEIRRLIREEEPPRPSTRITSLGATLATVSARRGTDPRRLSRLLRGELDWIVMRCLEKDRTRRYEAVGGLARDVQRYLADEPVEARPASFWYRAHKVYCRHRAALTVAAAFIGLAVVCLTLVTWKWQAERAARADAESRAREIIEGAERMNAASAAIDLAGQHVMLAQWGDARTALDRAIELRPDHSRGWIERGELFGRVGLWDLALQDFRRSFELRPPDQVTAWFKYALLHALKGDKLGYVQVCQGMLARFARSSDLFTRKQLIQACSLVPLSIPGHDGQAAYHDIADVPEDVLWVVLYGRGLANYRAGRFREAASDLQASLERTSYQSRNMNYPILAMALHRLGEADAAREALETSRRELDRWTQWAIDRQGQLVPWDYWDNWGELILFCDEACRLIDGAPAAADSRHAELRKRALGVLGLS